MPLTKTTTIDNIDPWWDIGAGTLEVGNTESLSSDYASLLYIEACPIEALAQDGMEIIIEISYANDNWVKHEAIKTATIDTPVETDLDGALSATDTAVALTDGMFFSEVGEKWFIWDTDNNSNSEIVRNKSVSGADKVLCSGVVNAHADAMPVFSDAESWAVELPLSAAMVRVLYNNVDADCDMAVTTRISKVTAL